MDQVSEMKRMEDSERGESDREIWKEKQKGEIGNTGEKEGVRNSEVETDGGIERGKESQREREMRLSILAH